MGVQLRPGREHHQQDAIRVHHGHAGNGAGDNPLFVWRQQLEGQADGVQRAEHYLRRHWQSAK